MVSASTKVPDMNATPSVMASALATSRILWAMRPRMAVRNMSGRLAQALHPLEHPLGRRVGELADEAPVGQEHDAVGVAGGDGIVGDHGDGLADAVDRPPEQL